MLSVVSFPVFVALALLLYFIVPSKFRWLVLLATSYFYYWSVGGLFAITVIALTSSSVFAAALLTAQLRSKGLSRSVRRIPLVLCLLLNFGMLVFFKYGGLAFPSVGMLLIPGISFYTFQAVGYLVDVYNEKIKPETNLFRFALFVGFFPQLIQGPISRHSNIATDLYAGHGWDFDRAQSGIQRIIWGYFMKLLIADYAAVVVNEVFTNYTAYGGAVIIAALFLYSIQIYADFAGGINIAIGIAEIVGVKLPENFYQPFFATSVSNFWRRWHITLGTWLKDYLFFPLALSKPFAVLGKTSRKLFGNKYGKIIPISIATLTVYGVVGIWHGSSLKYAAFGLYNGGIITLSLLFEGLFVKLRAKTGLDGSANGLGRVFAIIRTLLLIMFSRYFARAASLMTALRMIKRTFLHMQPADLLNGTLLNLGLGLQQYVVLGLSTALLLFYDIIAEKGFSPKDKLNEASGWVQFIVLFVLIGAIVFFGVYRDGYIASDFIYAGF